MGHDGSTYVQVFTATLSHEVFGIGRNCLGSWRLQHTHHHCCKGSLVPFGLSSPIFPSPNRSLEKYLINLRWLDPQRELQVGQPNLQLAEPIIVGDTRFSEQCLWDVLCRRATHRAHPKNDINSFSGFGSLVSGRPFLIQQWKHQCLQTQLAPNKYCCTPLHNSGLQNC